jgi:ribosome-associated toxin RatA of RatAB toxin-antitoxin module
MPSASCSTTIQAPPRRVFEVFSDLAHAAGRVKAIKAIELLTPGPMRVGARFRETRVMFGKQATEEMEVVEFEPERAYAVACESCGAYYHSRFTFTPSGAGTRVDMTIRSEARSLLAKLMTPLAGMMMKQCAKAFEADANDLKQVCEAR